MKKSLKRITATTLSEYYTCPLKAWHHIYHKDLQQEQSELQQVITAAGNQYEQQVIKGLDYYEIKTAANNFQEAYRETLTCIKNRTPLIYQPLLRAEEKGFELIGIPDLLQLKHNSGLHDKPQPVYQIKEIKSSLKITPSHIIQAAFCHYIMQKQITAASEYIFIPGRGREISFKASSYAFFLAELLRKARQELTAASPPCFRVSLICRDCSYENLCLEMAADEQTAGLVYGIRFKELALLNQHNLNNLSLLAAAKDLTAFLPEQRASMIGSRARALHLGEETVLAGDRLYSDKPVIFYMSKDKAVNKELLAAVFSPLDQDGELFFCSSDSRELVQELVSFIVNYDLERMIGLNQESVNLLKEEVLYPNLVGDGFKIQHITSLEKMAVDSLALSLYIYDYDSLRSHFKISGPCLDAAATEYYRNGFSGRFGSLNRQIIQNGKELFTKLRRRIQKD